jgi:hypothetical protein
MSAQTLIRAARLLEVQADALKASHTTSDGEWYLKDAADQRAEDDHDELLRTAARLRSMASQ